MANYSRMHRISEQVKRELSLVIRDLKHPRLPEMVSCRHKSYIYTGKEENQADVSVCDSNYDFE